MDDHGEQRWQALPEVIGEAWLQRHFDVTRDWQQEAYRARWQARERRLERPFTAKQLAAAKVIAPGMSVAELVDLRYSLDMPLPSDASWEDREQRKGVKRVMADIERGKIGRWRFTAG